MINVAVVGCGYWGPNLIRKFASQDQVNIRWICDLKEERLKPLRKHYAASRITRNVSDILQDPATEAVVIATPLATHYDLTRASLLAGKHVFVEKPFVPSSQQARTLTEIAEKKKKTLMIGFTYVYNNAIQMIKQLINAGKLGDIYYMNSVRVNLGIFRDRESVIWDLAAHDFSIMSYLFDDDIHSIVCTGRDSFKRGTADTVMITAVLKSGLTAYIMASWHSPIKMRNLIITGSKKMVFFNDEQCAEKIKIYNQKRQFSPGQRTGEYQPVANCNSVYSPWVGTADGLSTEAGHFLDCIRRGKRPITDGRMGIQVVRAMEAAERSLKLNRRVIVKG